jgi:hypothetical protein
MTIPCPTRQSGRHRWHPVASMPHDHRSCSQCGATARIDSMGRTVFVALLEVTGASITILGLATLAMLSSWWSP